MIKDLKVNKFKPNWNVPEGYKHCWCCDTIKSVDYFHKSKSKFAGRDGRCKDCHNKRIRTFTPEQLERRKEYFREWREMHPKNTTNWVHEKYGSYANYNAYLRGRDPK